MSQAGFQLYSQSMNGLINIENCDTIECFQIDAEVINTDTLAVNTSATINSLTLSSALNSNLIQTGTNVIQQSGTGFNTLKNSLIANIAQTVGGTINQSVGTTTFNTLNKTNMTGDLNINAGGINLNNGNLTITNGNLVSSIQQIGAITNNMRNTNFIGNVDVNGNMEVDNLTVSGNLTYDFITLDVDNLIVRDSALFECDVSMNNLDVYGNIRVTNLLRIGIDDPAGGSGDTATIEYVSKGITDQTVLRINTTNDPIGTGVSDDINLNPSGGVGIKTDNPVATLDVNGDCYINTILTTGGDTNVNGNLDVNNVLRTYPTSIRYDYVYNLTTPVNVTGVEILTFSVIPNVSGNFTVGYVCPISVAENGSRPLTGDITTTTTINSATASLYINNNLYKQQGAYFNGAYGVTHSFTVAQSAIPSLNPYNYQKYLNILSDTFSIEHTAQPTVSNYKIELAVSYTRTNILGTSVYNLILNTTQSGYTQLAILSFSPALVANYTAPRQDTIRDMPTTTDTGSILCNETYTNNIYCKNLYLDNVLYTIQFKPSQKITSINTTITLNDLRKTYIINVNPSQQGTIINLPVFTSNYNGIILTFTKRNPTSQSVTFIFQQFSGIYYKGQLNTTNFVTSLFNIDILYAGNNAGGYNEFYIMNE